MSFFVISKTLDFLFEPFYLALCLLVGAALLRWINRARRLRRFLVIATMVGLWIFSTGAVANLLLYPLETKYVRPPQLDTTPAAIVMLTGITDNKRKGPGYELSEGADRIVEAVRLAHLYPRALLVISGGSSAVFDNTYRESDTLRELAQGLGISPARIRTDRNSRNTYENAVESRRLLRSIKGPVLLVTSAFHMPRSVACFKKVGATIVPWPVDYYRTGSGFGSAWLPKPQSLVRSSVAIHEYVGLLFYRLRGYI